MRIGILSDSHGRTDITRRAVDALRSSGAELLLHLGDIETEDVIDELVGHNARIVFGNCDYDAARLGRYAEMVDVTVDHPRGEITVEDRQIAFTHGHLQREMNAAMESRPAYLLHGHTHETRDEMIGPTRVINPGALFRAQRYTAAILDPGTDHLEFLTVERSD